MDLSFVMNDLDSDEENKPKPKRPKRDGFIRTLDEAIAAEIYAMKTAKVIHGVTTTDIKQHSDLIKKFIGDYSRFETYNEREIKRVGDFFEDRIKKCYPFKTDGSKDAKISLDEMHWINRHYDTIVSIFYRTQEDIRPGSKVWYREPFYEISNNIENRLIHESFIKRVDPLLSIPVSLIKKMPELTIQKRAQVMSQVREKASTISGLSADQIDECLIGVEDSICNFVTAMNLGDGERTIRDDRETHDIVIERLQLEDYPIKLEQEETYFEVPEPVHMTKEIGLKSIIKKTTGKYYSDRNVSKMTAKERVDYSETYDLLSQQKKSVRFSGPPGCLVFFCENLEDFTDLHKTKNETSNRVLYPSQNTFFHVGEKVTSAIVISYNQYRVSCWNQQRPATAFTNINNNDSDVSCFKSQTKPETKIEDGIEVPAHKYLVRNDVVPLRDQNYLLEDHYKNLIKYSLFWQPDHRQKSCTYNHCYGSMVITDSILENASPNAVSNAGIFSFPYPLDELAVLAMLDELTPDQFYIRDIVFIWGFDSLLQKKSSEEAAADALTLYELVKVKMFSKYEEFKSKGYSRLFMPRFWLTTIPETRSLPNMENFNYYIRMFVRHSYEMEETSYQVGLVDWDQICQERECPVSCETAESQLELLYQVLEQKIALIRRRDNAAKMREIKKQLTRTNMREWIERME